jgi:transcriptional regulator with XRE-family HTH domain
MDIGKRIKALRQQLSLTQSELADRAELSKGFISQVERNLTSPSIATLTDILECLGTDLCAFFSDDGPGKVAFTPADMFEKEEENRLVRWLIPNAQKNEMEPILLTLGPGAQTETDDPHPGEEFGYVLAGSVTLTLGGGSYRVHKGGSFYYKTDAPHKLQNNGRKKAEVLWVSSPPFF